MKKQELMYLTKKRLLQHYNEHLYMLAVGDDRMDKQTAIQLIESIQNRAGLCDKNIVDKNIVPEIMRDETAKDIWYNIRFNIGCKYGAIAAIMRCFDITEEDMKVYYTNVSGT